MEVSDQEKDIVIDETFDFLDKHYQDNLSVEQLNEVINNINKVDQSPPIQQQNFTFQLEEVQQDAIQKSLLKVNAGVKAKKNQVYSSRTPLNKSPRASPRQQNKAVAKSPRAQSPESGNRISPNKNPKQVQSMDYIEEVKSDISTLKIPQLTNVFGNQSISRAQFKGIFKSLSMDTQIMVKIFEIGDKDKKGF